MPKIGDIKKGKYYEKSIWATCADCGRERWVHLYKGEPESLRCNSCARKGKRNHMFGKLGEDSPNWKNGRTIDDKGYTLIRISLGNPFFAMADHHNCIREHRLIMAKYLNRCLEPWEIVHHRNGIKNDNRIENLELLLSQTEHLATTILIRENQRLKRKNKKLVEIIKVFIGGKS